MLGIRSRTSGTSAERKIAVRQSSRPPSLGISSCGNSSLALIRPWGFRAWAKREMHQQRGYERTTTAKETAERAEIQSLQAQLRAIWAAQRRTEQAVPASRLWLIQLIEAATVSPGSADAEPEGDLS